MNGDRSDELQVPAVCCEASRPVSDDDDHGPTDHGPTDDNADADADDHSAAYVRRHRYDCPIED
jgi:hypothetical protein